MSGARLLLVLMGLLAAVPLAAIDSIRLDLGKLAGHGIQLEGLVFEWQLANPGSAQLRAKWLNLPEPVGRLESLALHCPGLSVSAQRVACEQGRLSLRGAAVEQQTVPVAFHWRRDSGQVQVALRGLKLFSGSVDARLNWHPEQGLQARLQLLDLAIDHDPLVVEGLRGELEVGLSERTGGRVQATLAANIRTGEMLWQDWYATVPKDGLRLTASALSKAQRWQVEQAELASAERWQVSGSALLDLAANPVLRQIKLRTNGLEIGELFEDFIGPNLEGTRFADARLQGRLSLNAEQTPAKQTLQWTLTGAAVQARTGRVDLSGIGSNGRWNTQAGGEALVQWAGGTLWNTLTIGPSSQQWRLHPDAVELTGSWVQPILDGALRVAKLRLPFPGAADDRVVFDGVLTPISLEKLSTAFAWPPLRGQVSGVVPGLLWKDRKLSLDGILLIRAFGGGIRLRSLSLADPFGTYPVLRADLTLNPIDLAQLTEAFSFGHMTGQLGGHVNGLVLEQWQPRSFDLAVATPASDDSRHRISQRAVEQFTELGGGGVGGALSRSYLRFFDTFGYDRLGFEAHLADGRLSLHGVEPAPDGGFYLVKGRGLPRVDVVGHNQQIDWAQFLANLKTAINQQEDIRIQ